MDAMFFSQFQAIGRDLFSRGLVSSHTGNLSIRLGDNLVIKRRSAQLGNLSERDLIETGIYQDDRSTPLASTELPVHRSIYRVTSAQAVVHAHPPHAVALSLKEEEIVPRSPAGLAAIGRVPVLGWGMEVKPGGLDDIIAEALKDHVIVMVHGHGSFARGQLLDEAFKYTTILEENCQVPFLLKSLDTD
ncbi:MAG: aldolase [Dehalococcoidales bacterium]|nr:aldolase [Dehalococcoidales bacterium]